MAGHNRRPTDDLKRELLEKGERFSFFQAMRLLRYLLARERRGEGKDPVRENIRIRPKLSLAHPSTELDVIEDHPQKENAFRITANFLGIYGESSPLPSSYTEDLIDEDQDKNEVTREFLDIINQPLYMLFYSAWTKNRPFLKIVDEKDRKYLDILYSLMGLGADGIWDDVQGSYQLLRYTGLFTQQPKSALGLKLILRDAVGEPTLDIEPCIKRKVRIPDDQRCYLGVSGNVLGKESYIGERIGDRMRKYRVTIGPLDGAAFHMLLPGTFKYRRIIFLSKFYLIDPYESDLKLKLAEGEVKTARLGDTRWSQLGYDAWVFSGDYNEPVDSVFELS